MNKKIQIGLVTLQILAALIFFVANWQADRALDKSGIGDPERFFYWNTIATYGARTFLLAWLVSVTVEQLDSMRYTSKTAKGIMRARVPIYIIVPPSVLVVLWIISIL